VRLGSGVWAEAPFAGGADLSNKKGVSVATSFWLHSVISRWNRHGPTAFTGPLLEPVRTRLSTGNVRAARRVKGHVSVPFVLLLRHRTSLT
jgi:hypothetical protein